MAAGDAVGRYRGTVGRSKDPSGLLISVIRTLSSSDDVEDRENEKGRLEEAYEKCDRELDELIVQHYTELTTAIRTYQSITERITNSRNKIRQVRASPRGFCVLAAPQAGLQLHISSLPGCFLFSVDSLEGPLLQVEGLSDLRLELHSKKMNLHLVLIDELHRHLYIKSTNRVGQRGKDRARLGSLVKDASPVPLMDVTNLSTPRKFLETSQFSTPGSSSMRDSSLLEMKEDTDLDPEENSAVFMGILIKGLAKLRKIPETVKAIQDRLEQELKQIVKRSTTQVADSGYQRGENTSQENQPRLLLELLELLFDKFNAVAAAHSVVLGHLQQTVASPCSQHEGDIKLYDMVDVWVKIQDVLQMLLTEYLDMKNTRTASEPSAQLSYASSGREFAAFFAKKKPQRPKNPLFKFESSSHAISMSAYLREQRRELYSRSGELQGGPDDNLIEGGGSKFVCKPGARNITIIFHPLLRFIQEIEFAMELGPAKQCPLREFLTMYIKNIFLNQVLAEINKEIEGVTKASDPLKILANADTMKVLGVQRPLLQVGRTMSWVCVQSGKVWSGCCCFPCRTIVQSDEKLVISASWAKDDDISRLLKSLPNWSNMAQPKQLRPKREEEEDFIRAAFGKESEVLIGNLGDKLIPQQEILRDVSDLKALANLHESLEWLAGRTKAAFSSLSASQTMSPCQDSLEHLPASEQILQSLSELARSFQEMADRSPTHHLPVLILGVLTNELLALNPFPLAGLGHLISCILINGAHYFKRISESGIKKMCRNIFILQQNLTNITMSREADLDFARQYYEMLYNTADELLNLVVDQGVKYTELEYIYALNLLHRSQTGVGDQTTQNMRLQRLKEIICEQAAIKQATKDKKITTV
uniref:Exocyst complex component Sec8 n=1 Tax=Ficedula albicollis TaxID=59894 RepID=U3KBG5_FICAL